MKIYLLFFIVLGFAPWLQAQVKKSELDSLIANYQEKALFDKADALIESEQKYFSPKDSAYWELEYEKGMNLLWQRKYDAAIVLFEKGLKASKPYPALYLRQANGLALSYSKNGELDHAEKLYQDMLPRQKALTGEMSAEYATMLHNLMVLYVRKQSYETAEAFGKQALSIREQVLGKNDKEYGASLNNLGAIYLRMGDYPKAERYFLASQTLYAANLGKEELHYINGLSELALLYSKMKRYDEAEKLYLEALAREKKHYGEGHGNFIKTMNNLATLYSKMKAYSKSEQILLRMLAFGDKMGKNSEPYSAILSNLAEVAFLQAHENEALNRLFQCLSNNARIELQPATIDSLWTQNFRVLSFAWPKSVLKSLEILYSYHLGHYEKNKDLASLRQAYWTARAGINYLEDIRSDKGWGADRFRLLQASDDWIQRAFDIELRLQEGKETSAQRAFDLMELNRSALLFESLQGSVAQQNGYLPDSLAQLEKDLQAKQQGLRQAIQQARDSATRQNLEQDLVSNFGAQNALRGRIKQEFPKYYELKYNRSAAKIEAIQAQLNPHTALLEYFVTPKQSYLLVILAKETKLISLPNSSTVMQNDIDTLFKCLSDYEFIMDKTEEASILYRQKAHALYLQLLAPFLSENKDPLKHLIIVPDGPLHRLPFDALLTDSPSSTQRYTELPYLLKKYALSYHYAGSLVLPRHNDPAKRQGQILGMAGLYQENTQTTNEQETFAYALRKQLGPLPSAQQEVEQLSASFAGRFFFGEQANEREFKRVAPEFDVIHLAAHGYIDEDEPSRSAMILSRGSGDDDDDLLHAYEIASLPLHARLVVLSACETGSGKKQQGEGVLSLGHAFLHAGVPTLLVSAWKVNDYATQRVMGYFYENLSQGMDQAEALRQAKLSYLEHAPIEGGNELFAHPAFWSAFVLVGQTDPLNLPNPMHKWLLWGGIGTLALAAGAYFAWRRTKKT